MEKVNVEFTLVAIAHNLRKMAKKAINDTNGTQKSRKYRKLKLFYLQNTNRKKKIQIAA